MLHMALLRAAITTSCSRQGGAQYALLRSGAPQLLQCQGSRLHKVASSFWICRRASASDRTAVYITLQG